MYNQFLQEKRDNQGLSSSYLRAYNSLFEHIRKSSYLSLDNYSSFTLPNILAFLRRESELYGWTDTTYNFYVKLLRVFLKYLEREGAIGKISSSIYLKKTDISLPKYIDSSGISYILSRLTEEEERVIRFFLYTGVRRFEFVGIHTEVVSIERQEIVIFGKGRKERVIPIHDDILQDIQVMKFPYMLQYIDNLRRKIQKFYPQFKLHNLRHTFATEMIRSEASLYTLAQIMGHSNINTTTSYLSLNQVKAKEEIKKISFIKDLN